MRPSKLTLTIFVLFLLITAFDCKKGGTACTGGKGGNATLLVTPEAHGTYLDSCMIYIRYGAKDLPANGVYDDSLAVALVDTTPIAAFHGLKAGCYYIFASGYHTGFSGPYVKGGVPYTIQNEDSQSAYVPTYSYEP